MDFPQGWQYSTSVSYTHLDVYKRQVEEGGAKILYVYYVIGNKEVVFVKIPSRAV